MTVNLYTVSVEYEYVIAVEEGEDPQRVAEKCFSEAKREMDVYTANLFVREARPLPEGWHENCLPYRTSSEEKTIQEILELNNGEL